MTRRDRAALFAYSASLRYSRGTTAVLARCLQGVDADGCPAAFALYEETRKPRAFAIQTNSSANTWLRGKTDPAWVYGYDAWTAPLGAPPEPRRPGR